MLPEYGRKKRVGVLALVVIVQNMEAFCDKVGQ